MPYFNEAQNKQINNPSDKGCNPYFKTRLTKRLIEQYFSSYSADDQHHFNCRLLHLVNVPLQRRHFQKEQRQKSGGLNTVTLTVPVADDSRYHTITLS